MRLMISPEPVSADDIAVQDGVLWRIDRKTGARTARLDTEGGGRLAPIEERPQIQDERDVDAIPLKSSREILAEGALDDVREIIAQAGDSMFMAAWAPPFAVSHLTAVRGKEQAMLDLIERPGFVHHVLAKAVECAIQGAIALAEVGIDAVMVGDTFGGVVGPRHFEEFCMPTMTRFVQAVRPHGVLTYLHVCGDSTRIVEMMADTGVDCIEPLDPLGGVAVADVKRRVGDRVALMGGVSTTALAHGSLEDVVDDCGRCLREGPTAPAHSTG